MFDKFIEICKQAYFMPDVRIMASRKYNVFCFKGAIYVIATTFGCSMRYPVTVYDYYEGSTRYISINTPIMCNVRKAINRLSLEIEDFYA